MDPVAILRGIVQVALTIRDVAQTVKLNKAKCQRLARRVQDLIPTLEALSSSPRACSEQARGAAESLLCAVQEAEALVRKSSARGGSALQRAAALVTLWADAEAFDEVHVGMDRALSTLTAVLQVRLEERAATAEERAADAAEDARALQEALAEAGDARARRDAGAAEPRVVKEREVKVRWAERLGVAGSGVFRGEWLGLPVAVKLARPAPARPPS
eukprot:tig00020723_g13448.t1